MLLGRPKRCLLGLSTTHWDSLPCQGYYFFKYRANLGPNLHLTPQPHHFVSLVFYKKGPMLAVAHLLPPFFFILCYPFRFPGKFLSSQDYCNTPCWPRPLVWASSSQLPTTARLVLLKHHFRYGHRPLREEKQAPAKETLGKRIHLSGSVSSSPCSVIPVA